MRHLTPNPTYPGKKEEEKNPVSTSLQAVTVQSKSEPGGCAPVKEQVGVKRAEQHEAQTIPALLLAALALYRTEGWDVIATSIEIRGVSHFAHLSSQRERLVDLIFPRGARVPQPHKEGTRASST